MHAFLRTNSIQWFEVATVAATIKLTMTKKIENISRNKVEELDRELKNRTENFFRTSW